jgi:hypothetical protein
MLTIGPSPRYRSTIGSGRFAEASEIVERRLARGGGYPFHDTVKAGAVPRAILADQTGRALTDAP